jgi:hypothetical protein
VKARQNPENPKPPEIALGGCRSVSGYWGSGKETGLASGAVMRRKNSVENYSLAVRPFFGWV